MQEPYSLLFTRL